MLLEVQKIHIALEYFTKERAERWANRQARMLLRGDPGALTTLAAFGEEVKKVFGDPEQKKNAQHEIMMLRQKEWRTGGSLQMDLLSALRDRFEELAKEAHFDEETLIKCWSEMLCRSIHNRIYDAEHLPSLLHEWKERSLRYEQVFKLREAENRAYESRRYYPERKGFWTPAADQRSRNSPPIIRNSYLPPPTNSTTRNSDQRRPPLTPAPSTRPAAQTSAPARPAYYNPIPGDPSTVHVPMEIDRTRRRGDATMRQRNMRCYRCGQLGHIARNCTAKMDVRVAETEEESKVAGETEATKDFQEADEL